MVVKELSEFDSHGYGEIKNMRLYYGGYGHHPSGKQYGC